MSTNKSQNLNLHLWEPEDDFLRTEFNENFAALDTAVKADRTAIATAQSTAEEKPYVMGTFMGGDKKAVAIDTGFKPSFVIIYTSQVTPNESQWVARFGFFGRAVNGGMVTMTDTGFRIAPMDSQNPFPRLHYSAYQYEYIAFR